MLTRLIAFGLCSFLLVYGAQADDLVLPERDAPEFAPLCVAMYAARDADEEWPASFQQSTHHCSLKTKDADPADMTREDFGWALRKSLTFACKKKREVIYDVMRRLKDCNGDTRTFIMTPIEIEKGACRVSFVETGEAFDVAPPLIEDLIDWRDDMPWYERILVDLFAPRELPMVMDGLIDCGGFGETKAKQAEDPY